MIHPTPRGNKRYPDTPKSYNQSVRNLNFNSLVFKSFLSVSTPLTLASYICSKGKEKLESVVFWVCFAKFWLRLFNSQSKFFIVCGDNPKLLLGT